MKIIPLNALTIDPDRQRQHFSQLELTELEESIFTHGLINPVMVRPGIDPNTYVLVAGERRYRAITARGAAFSCGDFDIPAGSIPVIVRHFESDHDAGMVELHENVMRVDLTWQERVKAIERLEEVAKARGIKNVRGEVALALSGESETPTSTAYGIAQKAMLVSQFMGDEEVAKASSLNEAARIASRKQEAALMAKLQGMSIEETPDAPGPKQAEGPRVSPSMDMTPKARQPIGVLHVGDCREELKKVADGTVSCVVTDPPYGMGADKFNDGGHSTTLGHKYDDSEEAAFALMADVIADLNRVCQRNAHVYVFCTIETFGAVKAMFNADWRVRRRPLIWNKGNRGKLGDGKKSGYSFCYECVLVAERGDKAFAAVVPDVLTVPIVTADDKVHAAEKPVELYKALLRQSTMPRDMVLDPFCGSGTIFAAARDLGLNPIGIELDEMSAMYAREKQK